jgi:hypothetical protein
MTPLVIRSPTKEERERSRKFLVHKNYVGAVAQNLEATYDSRGAPMLGRLVEAQTNLGSFRRIQRRPVKRAEIARYLHLAWANETQFRLSHLADSGLLQFSNA